MISVETRRIGIKKVSLITISNEIGLKLVLCSIGASIYKCFVGSNLVSYQPDNLKDFINSRNYFGKTAGRTAGRIRNGTFSMNGKSYKLKNNNVHSLHGGEGFSFKNYLSLIQEDDNEYRVIFEYVSKDNENGYPGELINQVQYRIPKSEMSFEIKFKAISNKDTICNLTNHTYWNLNNDSKSIILKHKMSINASKYVIIDNDLLKIKESEVDKIFDFRKERLIEDFIFEKSLQDVSLGYDHDWILDKNDGDLALSLKSDDDSLLLKVYTSNPVCHIYSGNYMNEKYKAMAIEMQKRIFDVDEGKVNLKANEKYDEYIKYVFEKLGE